MRAPLARLVELASHMDRSMHHIPRGRGSCLRVANAVPEHVLSWSVAALAAAVLLPFSGALMYDVVDPSKLPPAECASGCARWAHLLEDGAVLPETLQDTQMGVFIGIQQIDYSRLTAPLGYLDELDAYWCAAPLLHVAHRLSPGRRAVRARPA